MMKKRKFGAGGPAKRPMPTPADRAAARAQDEMLKKAKVTKSEAATLASAARASKEDAKDFNAVKKYAKGGKVKKRYADGDLVMGDAASDTSGLSLGMPSIDTDLRRALTDKELMDANLAAVRAREAASMTKPKPKPKAVAPKPKPKPKAEAPKPKPKPETPASKPPAEKPSDALNARARQITEERKDSFFKRPLTPAETREEASKTRVPAPSVTRGYADRGARTLADRKERVAKNAATEAARPKKPNIFQRMYDMTVNPGVDKKYAKGGVTRADGCAVRGKTKGKMV